MVVSWYIRGVMIQQLKDRGFFEPVVVYGLTGALIGVAAYIYLWQVGLKVRFARLRLQQASVVEPLLSTVDSGLLLLLLLTGIVVVFALASHKWLASRREVVLVVGGLLVTFVLFLVVSFAEPGYDYATCRSFPRWERSGECLSMMENAGAWVVVVLWFFYGLVLSMAMVVAGWFAVSGRLAKGVLFGVGVIAMVFGGFWVYQRNFVGGQQEILLQEKPLTTSPPKQMELRRL